MRFSCREYKHTGFTRKRKLPFWRVAVLSAFEVEKSTSIYSGILRLTDLALTLPNSEKISLYLAAPEQREKEIIAQLKRPSLVAKEGTKISYILFSELCTHCDSICKFGDDYTIMEKIAKCITLLFTNKKESALISLEFQPHTS